MEELLEELIDLFKRNLQSNLTGIYLHGSMAMNGFQKEFSDVDLLVVVKENIKTKEKQTIINDLQSLKADLPAKGIEMSIIKEKAISHFEYPTPYELHYSETHQEIEKGYDPDLAAHMTVVYHRGKCLYGLEIKKLFVPIDEIYFLKSILSDVIGAEITENPMYYTLNYCRVLVYFKEKKIVSKKEGGEWGLRHLPEPHRSVVDYYFKEYTKHETESWLKPSKQDLIMFASFMERAINGNGHL